VKQERFNATTAVTTKQDAAMVALWLVASPMTVRWLVSRNSGMSAKGMPKDSTTWEMTSAWVGSTPMASTTKAGIRVMVRRSSSGIRRRSRPSMMTAPA
jgi:hypothetical protein